MKKRVEYVPQWKFPKRQIWRDYISAISLKEAKNFLDIQKKYDADSKYRILKRTITEEVVK